MARKNKTRSAFGDGRQKLRLDRATACALTPKEQAMRRTVLGIGPVRRAEPRYPPPPSELPVTPGAG
jgi:hypothetical protein